MTRCCLCRESEGGMNRASNKLEPTDLPGTGWRCTDHDACRQRVRATIAAHVGLAEVCDG
jgi:imidazolonepropionase-like amidohydrolase